jgi:hypothetical protein
MTSYPAVFSDPLLKKDPSFVTPVVVPNDWFGYHNNSIGQTLVGRVTRAAIAHCEFDSDDNLVVVIDDPGAGYYIPNNREQTSTVDVQFSGGDFSNYQAIGAAILDPVSTGISGVRIVKRGDYRLIPPSITFGLIGGPNVPAVPICGTRRVHDYVGSINSPYTPPPPAASPGNEHWYDVDPGWDGVGTFPGYNWAILDEIITASKGRGESVLYTLYGTPQNYATHPTIIGQPWDNAPGSSSPLNTLGYTTGVDNVGLEGFIKALVTRYNVNAHALVNPITGDYFPAGTRLIDYIEVLNEPAFAPDGGSIAIASGYYWIGTASQAVDWARIVNLTAKAIDSNIKVIGCGFVSSSSPVITAGQRHDIGNFLLAVDTGEGTPGPSGKTGAYWIDGLSYHSYDIINNGSCQGTYAWTGPSQEYGNVLYNAIFDLIKQGSASSGITDFYITECGFYATGTDFKKNLTETNYLPSYLTPDPNLSAIIFKRMISSFAALGVKMCIAYSANALNSNISVAFPEIYKAYEELAMINGKTIIEVWRGPHNQNKLVFSDETFFYSG